MYLKKRIILIMLMALFVPVQAFASLESQMTNMFEGMTNVTDPSAFKSARRGVIQGGSVVAKVPIWDKNIVSFTPPSLDAGCGGIDFYGGSFSYIDADEFISGMRAIAQNAGGYAFDLALSAMCPSCSEVIKTLQKAVRTLNGMASNSCATAQKLVNATGLKSWSDSQSQEMGTIGTAATAAGKKVDAFDQWFNNLGKDSNSEDLSDEELIAAGIMQNVTWYVLTNDSDFSGATIEWFEEGDDDMARVIMSVIGTVIYSRQAEGEALQPSYISPLITLETLLEGDESGSIMVYKCDDDDEEKCLTLERVELEGVEGVYEKVETALLGGTDEDGTLTSGVVQKFISNSGELTATEKALIDTLPDHSKRLRDLSIYSPGDARIYAKLASKTIALEFVTNFFEEVIKAMYATSSRNKSPLNGEFMGQLDKARANLMTDITKERDQIKSSGNLSTVYDQMMSGASFVEVDFTPISEAPGRGAVE